MEQKIVIVNVNMTSSDMTNHPGLRRLEEALKEGFIVKEVHQATSSTTSFVSRVFVLQKGI